MSYLSNLYYSLKQWHDINNSYIEDNNPLYELSKSLIKDRFCFISIIGKYTSVALTADLTSYGFEYMKKGMKEDETVYEYDFAKYPQLEELAKYMFHLSHHPSIGNILWDWYSIVDSYGSGFCYFTHTPYRGKKLSYGEAYAKILELEDDFDFDSQALTHKLRYDLIEALPDELVELLLLIKDKIKSINTTIDSDFDISLSSEVDHPLLVYEYHMQDYNYRIADIYHTKQNAQAAIALLYTTGIPQFKGFYIPHIKQEEFFSIRFTD